MGTHLKDINRILVIRLKSMGDVVFTLPAVNAIRQNFPNAHLTFLTSQENTPIVSSFAGVDEVIGLDRAALRRGDLKAIPANTVGLALRLRRKSYNLAIDLQGYGETALLTWLTQAPRRWGSVYAKSRGWAYTCGVRRSNAMHPVDWNLTLLQQCGLTIPITEQNRLRVSQPAIEAAAAFFASHRIDLQKPLVYIQPFTSSPEKDWPLQRFLAAAEHWTRAGIQVIFGGGPADVPRLEPIRKLGFALAAGASLTVAAGLISQASVVIGGDTGLLHLAIALNRRVVMLARVHGATPPYQHVDWLLRPGSGVDVSDITLESVIDATAKALAEVQRSCCACQRSIES